MRRAQIDRGSQPVRNLAFNPKNISVGSNASQRTNLCAYPSLEGGTGTPTIRTNLCTDPRGIFNTSGYGTQTITTNVAITGHPEGITTAVRIAYTGTDTNPGLNLLNPLVSGTQYTASAWVYHETTGGGSQGLAQAGVASMPTPPAIVTGAWNRISWTFTASGTSQVGFRVSANTGAGSFLITGMVVETTSALGAYFDGTTPAATRINLAPNPQANSVTGWSPLGSAAGTTAAVTGEQAHNGTTSIKRVLTADGSAGFKAVVSSGFIPGETVSWSLWFYPVGKDMTASPYWERSNPYAGGGGGSAVVCPANTWTKLTGTLTLTATQAAGNTFGFGFLISGTSLTGDTFYVDEALIERSATLGAYFDGTTATGSGLSYGWYGTVNNSPSYAQDSSFTYAWAGTANASVSYQKAVQGVAGWSPASLAAVYQSSVSPQLGSKCGGVQTKGSNGDGIFTTDIAVVAGAAYTWSAWIKITEAVPNLSSAVRWKDNAQTILRDDNTAIHGFLVVGSWVRVSATSVAPAGATLAQCMWRIFATHTGTTFYVDGVMFEQSPVLSPYFDGTTAAAGDFTYNWNGVGHASSSTQWAKPVTGTITTRSSTGVSIDSKFFSYQTTLEDGAKGARFVAPAGTANSGWRVAGLNSATGWDWSKIKAGGQYTLFFRWRSFGWAAASSAPVQITTGGAQNPVIGGTNITMNQTGWQEYRRTFTALRDADNQQWVYISLPTTPSTSTDGIFDIRDFGLYEGEYNGDLITGTTPLSKWDGAADNSTSVGYPPQFLDIAGAPMAALYSEGTTLAPISGGAFDDCTVYHVYEVYNPVAEWTSTASIGGWTGGAADYATKGAFTYGRRNYGDLATSHSRVGNSANNNVSGMGTAVPGLIQGFKPNQRHVVTMQLTDGASILRSTLNGGSEAAFGFTAGNGIAREAIKMRTGVSNTDGTASTAAKGLALLYFPGRHDAATRLAMQRYLGNKYGAAVA